MLRYSRQVLRTAPKSIFIVNGVKYTDYPEAEFR